jgi:hypothetical protein
MSTTSSKANPEEHDHVLRPRAVKPGNPDVLRAQGQEPHINLNGIARNPSDLSTPSR